MLCLPDELSALALREVALLAVRGGGADQRNDLVALEEPLEICLSSEAGEQVLTVTMRTPGADAALALGLLLAEGVISNLADVLAVERVHSNRLVLCLRNTQGLDMRRFQREFISHSSCGVCGKMSIEALALQTLPVYGAFAPMALQTLLALPDRLRVAQTLFDATGAVHAAGLFDRAGNLLTMAEDVGRHNAMDKVIGQALLQRLPLADSVLVTSARAGFELVQKARAAGVPVLLAVGAPTSLAVELAEQHGVTLLAFARGDRVNIYAGGERVAR